jgi:hypothetical protein
VYAFSKIFFFKTIDSVPFFVYPVRDFIFFYRGVFCRTEFAQLFIRGIQQAAIFIKKYGNMIFGLDNKLTFLIFSSEDTVFFFTGIFFGTDF